MLSWLPAGGADGWPHFLLPAIALALPFSGAIARLCRGSVMDTLLADHLRTARAKGLSRRQLVMRHVLPLSLLPVLSYLGPASAACTHRLSGGGTDLRYARYWALLCRGA